MVWCLYPQRLAAWLIESGADPNEMDDSGQTALHTAMEYDNFAVVSTLARKGGDVNLKRRCDGRSVVRTLRRRGYLIELQMRAREYIYLVHTSIRPKVDWWELGNEHSSLFDADQPPPYGEATARPLHSDDIACRFNAPSARMRYLCFIELLTTLTRSPREGVLLGLSRGAEECTNNNRHFILADPSKDAPIFLPPDGLRSLKYWNKGKGWTSSSRYHRRG